MSRISKAIISLALGLILVNPINTLAVQQRRRGTTHGSTAQRVARARNDLDRERREKTFQIVWQTVADENFDPTFGGVNWNAVRLRYAPRVASVATDNELYLLLQQMLGEIPQSHFAIIPPDRIPRIRSKRRPTQSAGTDETEAVETLSDDEVNEGDNEIATQMLNGIGVDVRILKGQVVLTSVTEGGAAARAGLRPGFIIRSIDDLPLTGIPANMDLSPTVQMRLRQRILVDYLGGEPGSIVHLTYLDAENKEQQLAIKRERLKGTLLPSVGNLPPLYSELETRRLANKIGYLRFTVFAPQLAEKICEALKAMRDAPGLVIDLRGNPGGVMGMASGIVGLLTNRTGLIGVVRTRSGMLPIPTFPQRSSYSGPIVLLVDRLSGSTAEVMAAALQESGRALIVGERSAGQVLGANIKKLPTGALFEYARAGFKTSEGMTLEGTGVTPDVEKQLDRGSLLKGEDNQLQEAIRQIELRKAAGGPSADTRAERAVTPAPPPPQPVVVAPRATASNQPAQERGANSSASPSSFKSTPLADSIMERYIRAVGGREAIKRITSRVSVGVCTYPFQDLSGRVTLSEQAPNKRSMQIDIPNLGTTKIVFDGKRGWMQNSLMGFFEYREPLLSALGREFDFHKLIKYRELYSEVIYKDEIDTLQGRVQIVELVAPDGTRDELHFDAKTGLLLFGGGVQLGDYRQVGDVKVPFLMTILIAGLEVKIQFEQVSQNVEISEEAFAEPHSCFTGQ